MPLSTFYIPPYWGKIFELNKLLYENPDVKYFIWIDSDATIINVNKLNLDCRLFFRCVNIFFLISGKKNRIN